MLHNYIVEKAFKLNFEIVQFVFLFCYAEKWQTMKSSISVVSVFAFFSGETFLVHFPLDKKTSNLLKPSGEIYSRK